MKPANSWVTGAVVSLYQSSVLYSSLMASPIKLTSSRSVGCFVGAMSIGFLADGCGRERTLSIASVVFIIGAVVQAAAYDVPTITIGRVVRCSRYDHWLICPRCRRRACCLEAYRS
jgi:MFS family permease